MFAKYVQEKAAEQNLSSPSKLAQKLEDDRKASHKRVPETVKSILKEYTKQKGTSNPAKGKRKPKSGAAAALPESADV